MSKRHKKKRNKKYTPKEGVVPTQPVIHTFVAEDEARKGKFKRWRRWLLIAAGAVGLAAALWFLLQLVF